MKDKLRATDRVLPELMRIAGECSLCARKCGVDRTRGEEGYCKVPFEPVVYSYSPHHGEEPPLSGDRGSGTIFFSRCSMSCVYCQNWQFSQISSGEKVSCEELAGMMMELQDRGCHNINFVTPTHFTPAIVKALSIAYKKGLRLPLVYNTGGYDSPEVIKLLEGVVDIYLPDMRYASDEMAGEYSDAPGYVENNRAIVKEMYRQAGPLELSGGVAKKGVIIRLLVLPGNISGTVETLEFLADEIGRNIYLSVMSQYYPAHKACEYKGLSRRITAGEYARVVDKVHELGFEEGWIQPFEGGFDERFAGENI